MAVVNGFADNGSELKNQLSLLSAELTKIDIMIGSHDDSSHAERSYFNSLGATICEFPTSIVTAEYAKSIGNPVIMGAPNVVRGGSQSGSISATDLIMADLCDALVSDYYYPALANSVWTLHDKDLVRFERAWGLISLGPARALNLNTKGQLKIGYCADFVVMDPNKRLIEATFCNGKPTYMSGNFASKVLEKNI
jgi:alpha-D-ribose 1-methylphosphonate 5-triphosphate diphosphatase